MHDPFPGFDEPTANYSKLPHALIDAFPIIETVSELEVILYVLRHTWGFGEYDGDGKRITLDEFANGRKRRDGSRLDGGTGLTPNAIKAGVRRAVEHGFLIQEGDGRDAARASHKYRLRMSVDAGVSESDRVSNFDTQPSKFDSQPSNFDTQPSNFDTRSEKDTSERNQGEETPATPPDDADGDSVIHTQDFRDMLTDLRERLKVTVNDSLKAELAAAFRENPRRLRGLYEYARGRTELNNPAGAFIHDLRTGVQLEDLPAAVQKLTKPPDWMGHIDPVDGKWIPHGPRPSMWGRRPDGDDPRDEPEAEQQTEGVGKWEGIPG